MKDRKMLALRLEGALQSWDAISKWDERGTGDFPTKSAIVGLIGCALGLERGSQELVELNRDMIIAVRADRKGEQTVDFQTVTGNPLRNADGKPKTTGNTLISLRSYLQDACFTVFLELGIDWHKRVVDALKTPKWTIYLGRKTCAPSRPVLECEDMQYDSLMEALYNYPAAKRSSFPMSFETELQDDELSSFTRPDSLVYGQRGFELRRIWRGVIEEKTYVFD